MMDKQSVLCIGYGIHVGISSSFRVLFSTTVLYKLFEQVAHLEHLPRTRTT